MSEQSPATNSRASEFEALTRQLRLANDELQALKKSLEDQVVQQRHTEERFRLLVEGTKDYALFLLDPKGRVVSWNPGAERIKGYRAAEIVGQHFSRFYPAADVAAGKPQRELEIAAAQGKYEEEGWRVRKDGSLFWANVLITALWDTAGNPRGFSKITRDMTERKEADRTALRLAEERAARQAAEASARTIRAQREQLRVTLESIGDAVIATDGEGKVTLLNPVAQVLTGWTNEEAAGQPLETVFAIKNELTGLRVENPVARVLREGAVVGLANHTVLTARDGSVRPIEDSAAPIRDDAGRTSGVVLVFRDVTEKRQAESAMRLTQERYRLIVETAQEGIWLIDAEGKTQFTNARMAQMLACTVPELGERSLWDFLYPDTREQVEAQQQRRKQGIAEQVEMRFRRGDDSELWGLVSTGPVYDADGRYSGSLALISDITERREADRKKDEFLAMLAHELRNPLAPIRNAIQILRIPEVDAATAERAREMMERQIKHLVRLVDDLLDISRIMRGKIGLRTEPVELAPLVARAVETVQPALDAQNHQLIITLPPLPVTVNVDHMRLAQVLSNLLANSAKYMEDDGHIWLTAEVHGADLVLKVRDTGIGIAADFLPRVFDLFFQAEHGVGRAQGGLGIGLTLVRRLVEMHGGCVSAHSAGVGKGSEFVVRLPGVLQSQDGVLPKREADQAPPAPVGPRRRILVVDDNVDAAESLAMLLGHMGQDVRVAHDGLAALKTVQVFRPQLVFLDLGMPGMDGFEVARRVRKQFGREKPVLIALTGWGQDEDRRRTRESGFDDHLVKPVEPQTLQQVLLTDR